MFFCDDCFWCVGDKVFICQFVFDMVDFVFDFCYFFCQMCQFIFFVDEVSYWDQQFCVVDDFCNGNWIFVIGRQYGDVFQMCQGLQEVMVFIYVMFCICVVIMQQQFQWFVWCDIYFCMDVMYCNDCLFQLFGVGQCGFINLRCIVLWEWLQYDGVGSDIVKYFYMLLDGFGDEWNDWMCEVQQIFQYGYQCMVSIVQFGFGFIVYYWFSQFQILVIELVLGEFIQNVCSDIEVEVVQCFVVCFDGLVEFSQNLVICQ